MRHLPPRTVRPLGATFAALTALTAAVGVAGVTEPAAASPSSPCGSIYGQRDSAVGLPSLADNGHAQSGAVDVTTYDHTRSRFSLSTLDGSAATTGARFGAAVVIQDVDHDGCEDLVVGAPGGKGSVRIVHGTRSGITPTGSITITASDGKVGDSFGAAVAVGHVNPDGTQELWIGAPDATVGGKARAGKVYHYILDGHGVATFRGEAGYAAAAVPGTSAAGDRFGSILMIDSPVNRTTSVVVGVPLRDVSGHGNAGEIVVLGQDATGPIVGTAASQATAGVPGTPETGGHFGASLAVNPLYGGGPVVGIPDEDVGSIVDAGAVQSFGVSRRSGPATITAGEQLTQNSPGVPGVAERGDRFGASVGVLSKAQGEDTYTEWVIGSPGESLGSILRAGTVTSLTFNQPFAPPSRVIYQGHGAPGTAEKDDAFGATIAVWRGEEYYVSDYPSDDYLVGVPGEDGRVRDSGVVQPSWDGPTYGSVTGPIAGLRYGTVLGVGGPGDQILVG